MLFGSMRMTKVLILTVMVLLFSPISGRADDNAATAVEGFLNKTYMPLREAMIAQSARVTGEYKSKIETVRVIGQMIAFVLFVYAFVKGVASSSSPKEVMMLIAKVFTLTACVALVPTFLAYGDQMSQTIAALLSGSESVTGDDMVKGMLQDLRKAAYGVKPPTSWIDVGAAVSNGVAFLTMMVGFFCVAGMDIVLLVLNLVRSLMLTFSEIFLPVGIAMMAIGMLSGIGRTWIMATVGVLLWPVGWGLVLTFARPITQALGQQMIASELQTSGVLVNFTVVLYILVSLGICILWVAVTRVISRAMQGSGDIAGPVVGAALSMPMKGAGMASKMAADIAVSSAKAGSTGGASVAVDAGRMAARAASRRP